MAFALSGPTTISIKQGESASAIYQAIRTSKPYRQVSFSVLGLPPGITGSFSPVSGTPTVTTTLRLTASLTSAVGNFPIQVRARDAKSTKTIEVTLSNYINRPATNPPCPEANYIWQRTWSEASPFTGLERTTCCEDGVSQTIVTTPTRKGGHAVKLLLDSDVLQTDPGVRGDAPGFVWDSGTGQIERAELTKYSLHAVHTYEAWYGFSVMIDNSWADPSTDPNGTIIAQIHNPPDACDSGLHSPKFSIQVRQNMNWRVQNIYNTAACDDGATQVVTNYELGAVTKGVWVDWVVHAKWAFDNTGVLEVWKDGVKVIDRQNQPNAYNDQTLTNIRLSIYKSWWGSHQPASQQILIAYFDCWRVTDSTGCYDAVDPATAAG